MKRAGGIICATLVIAALAPAARAVDVTEYFYTDPAESGRWILTSGWKWSGTGHKMVSSPDRVCTTLWEPNLFGLGSYHGRIKLLESGGKGPAKAQFLFTWRRTPYGAEYYFVTLSAGSPGRLTLGKRRAFGAATGRRVLASAPAEIRLGEWYEITVSHDFFGCMEVFLAGESEPAREVLHVHRPDPQYRRGRAGFRTVMTRAECDNFSTGMTDRPRTEYCRYCHSGRPPGEYGLAPNVMTYWDGTWWDEKMGGGPMYQQGGHGDRNGLPALSCAGVNGCHDMTESAETHADGNRHDPQRGADHRTGNTYHLRRGFINQNPVNPWDVQVTFDNYCYSACHKKYGSASIRNHRHLHDEVPATGAVKFGTHLTLADADNSSPRFPYPIDSDLTTLKPKPAVEPPYDEDFAPCVSCHDPHGTGITDHLGSSYDHSNYMVRGPWTFSSELCMLCHY